MANNRSTRQSPSWTRVKRQAGPHEDENRNQSRDRDDRAGPEEGDGEAVLQVVLASRNPDRTEGLIGTVDVHLRAVDTHLPARVVGVGQDDEPRRRE